MDTEQKIFLEKKYLETKKEQPLIKKIKDILVSLVDNTFLVVGGDLETRHLNRLITDGNFEDFNTMPQNFIKGRDSQCHENSFNIWYNESYLRGTDEWEIVTGYALSEDGLWREHTWLINIDGYIYETTEKRIAYYGYTLNPEEYNYWINDLFLHLT